MKMVYLKIPPRKLEMQLQQPIFRVLSLVPKSDFSFTVLRRRTLPVTDAEY